MLGNYELPLRSTLAPINGIFSDLSTTSYEEHDLEAKDFISQQRRNGVDEAISRFLSGSLLSAPSF
jgi:hypothetical protein